MSSTSYYAGIMLDAAAQNYAGIIGWTLLPGQSNATSIFKENKQCGNEDHNYVMIGHVHFATKI